MMRLGITLPLDGFQNSHLPELARHAEKHGFTDGWSYETFESEAIVPLAAAAVATERMRLGTAIIAVFTRPPALIALTAASLQRLSGGRFVLGLGISTNTIVQQWMGGHVRAADHAGARNRCGSARRIHRREGYRRREDA